MQVIIEGKAYDIDNNDILELGEDDRAYLRPSHDHSKIFLLRTWIMAHNKAPAE